MKKTTLIILYFIHSYCIAQQGTPFEKYGPFQTKNYTSFSDALKNEQEAFKLKSENEDLSKDIRKLKNLGALQVLILTENNLDSLPQEVSTLSNLMYFESSKNSLKKIPTGVSAWQKLVELHLFNTQLDSLPLELKHLPALKIIEIQNNSNKNFKLGKGLEHNKSLQEIILYKNNLKSFPSELLTCKEMKEIVITSCGITKISDSISKLSKLEALVLDSNLITEIPKSVFELSNLKYLSIKGNKLKIAPENLYYLQKLEILDLRENPIAQEQIDVLRALMPKCKILFEGKN